VSKAVIQLIPLDGVVRFGPECDEFGKPYAGLAGFRFIDGGVEIIGMAKHGTFTREDYNEIVSAFGDIGRHVKYDRRDGVGKLKRSVTAMGKHNLPDVSDAVKGGKVDLAAMERDLQTVVAAIKRGDVTIEIGDQVDGNGDAVAVSALIKAVASLDHNDVLVWFVRREK
jgi:hypothetical protein